MTSTTTRRPRYVAKTIALGSGNVEITEPGTYILTGTLSNGQVIVNSSAEGKVRIVLSNASITNSSGAAIDVRAADEVVVVLAEGTSNSLTDGSGYDTSGEDAADAALFSMADLTIGGTGSLIVTGNTADWSSSAGPSRSRPPTTASGARTTW